MPSSRIIALSFASAVTGAFSTDVAGAAAMASKVDVCTTGALQSPIDLHLCSKTIEGDKYNIPLERPKIELGYVSSTGTLTKVCEAGGCNLHLTPKLTPGVDKSSNMLKVPGVGSYVLDHCTFHMPSEHTINHNHYPLEVQCHHTMEGTGGKRKGTVSTLYEQGTNTETKKEHSSGMVEAVMSKIPKAAAASVTLDSVGFYPTGSAGKTRYHSYEGSHTTGDCKEGVHWYVMYDPAGVSQEQLDTLKNNMGAEGWKKPRPLQALMGRHPEGCHHAHSGAASSAAFSALAVALFSLFARA